MCCVVLITQKSIETLQLCVVFSILPPASFGIVTLNIGVFPVHIFIYLWPINHNSLNQYLFNNNRHVTCMHIHTYIVMSSLFHYHVRYVWSIISQKKDTKESKILAIHDNSFQDSNKMSD